MRKGLSAAVIAILLGSFSVAAPPASSAKESSTPITGSVPGQPQATVTKEGNESRLQEDKRFQFDPTRKTMTNEITQAGPRYTSTAKYLTPSRPGTYFVEVIGLKLSVPSWGYKGQYGGLRFAVGRYNCPQYTHYSDLCSFPEMVEDKTTISRP